MPYRKIFFEKNQPVHIVSRALINVFQNKEDCYRFIFQFQAANLGKRGSNIHAKDAIKVGQALLEGENISSRFIIKEHDPLVDMVDFALVKNHYHFYLVPNIENSVPILAQKLNGGFAKFFNLFHGREDAVFGRRYKSVIVETDSQSDAVIRYISVINPLDVFQPGWREKGLKNPEGAFAFLQGYEFSSFLDRIGKRKSKILASDEKLEKFSFGGNKNKKGFQECIKKFLEERKSYSAYFLE